MRGASPLNEATGWGAFMDAVVYDLLASAIKIPRLTVSAWHDLLAPAEKSPDCPSDWREASTWIAVRAAVGWHRRVQAGLERLDWPSIQAEWHAVSGFTWDPWGLGVAAHHASRSSLEAEFSRYMHHPIRPSGALWAFVATPLVTKWPSIQGLPAVVQLDHVLRSLNPPPKIPLGQHFWNAWQEWIQEPEPEADTPLSSLYPFELLARWERSLRTSEMTEDAARGTLVEQLSWW